MRRRFVDRRELVRSVLPFTDFCRHHKVEVRVRERQQVASVVVERVEQRAKHFVVPLGEFRRAIVRDTERGRLRIVERRSDDRDLGPAETLRRFEREPSLYFTFGVKVPPASASRPSICATATPPRPPPMFQRKERRLLLFRVIGNSG